MLVGSHEDPDVAILNDELFVGTGSDIGGGLFASKDPGKTWRQNVHRLEAFQGKLLYTVSPGYNSRRRGEAVDRPLFLLSDLDQRGILRVPFFTDMTIADIKARSDRLYVLAVEEAEKSFVAKVYETTDLNHWQLALQHSCSAFPNALEIMPNQFVIGLANPSAGESNTSSGDILIFQRMPTPAPYSLRKTR